MSHYSEQAEYDETFPNYGPKTYYVFAESEDSYDVMSVRYPLHDNTMKPWNATDANEFVSLQEAVEYAADCNSGVFVAVRTTQDRWMVFHSETTFGMDLPHPMNRRRAMNIIRLFNNQASV